MGDDLHAALAPEHLKPRGSSRREVLGLIEITAAMALAGSSVVVGKVLSVRVPVFLSAELSLCAALVTMLPIQATRLRELRLLNMRELTSMFFQALFGIVLFRICTLYGLHFTSAAHAGLITSAAPILMAVFAALFLKERMGFRGAAGILLAASGLVLVNVTSAAGQPAAHAMAGNLLILAATVCEALLTVFRKSSGGRISCVTNTTVLVAISALVLLPFALLDLRGFGLGAIDTYGWAAVIYYGAVATTTAYMLWGDGAIRIPATRVGVATSAMPVTALCLSALVLGETLGASHIVGCLLIIAGILVARR